jgi:Icc-related predicted phosphoesterase
LVTREISHRTNEVKEFLNKINLSCPKCWVPGNHDIWVIDKESEADASEYRYRNLFPRISEQLNWYYLPQNGIRLEKFQIEIVGSIGWYTGEGYSEWFDGDASNKDEMLARELAYELEIALKNSKFENVIVVIHHVPNYQILDPHKDNRAEVNKHTEKLLIDYESKISLVVHGHRHQRYGHKKVTGINYIAHPFGYPHQHSKVEDGFRLIEL